MNVEKEQLTSIMRHEDYTTFVTTDVDKKTGDIKFTAKAYNMNSGSEIKNGLTYAWKTDFAKDAESLKVDLSGHVVSSGGSNATCPTIIVDKADQIKAHGYYCDIAVASAEDKPTDKIKSRSMNNLADRRDLEALVKRVEILEGLIPY